MQQRQLYVMLLSMVISGHVFFVRAKNKETACSPNDVVVAMTICQGERQQLSYSSQLNNTPQLCKALQSYNDCMKPRVQGCQGPAKMAFDVITSKYTGEPYKCQLDMQTEKDASNINDQINETSASKDYDDNLNTSNEANADSSLDDSVVLETRQQSNSTEATSIEATNNVSSKDTTATTITTIKHMTSYNYSNSAKLNKLTMCTSIFSAIFTVIHIWKHNFSA